MAEIPAEIEGPISEIQVDSTGTGVVLTALEVDIVFVPGMSASGRKKTIKTPSKEITPMELLSTDVLPGRTLPGFRGGTVIAEGVFVNDPGVPSVLKADFLQVEPGETVLIGALTRNEPGMPRLVAINSVPVVMLTHPLLPANPDDPANPLFHNQYGFPIKVESAVTSPTTPGLDPPPDPTSAEGYFADGAFHAFRFEYGGTGELLVDPSATPQIVIERAAYRDEGARVRYEARGHVTTAHVPPGSPTQDVELFRLDRNPATNLLEPLSIDSARVQQVEPGFERWRAEARENKPGGFRSGAPEFLLVVNHSAADVEARMEPDIREE